ncbi:MAG: hypothetical protein EA427_07100, partial [Spirochaetaceae bacterium]
MDGISSGFQTSSNEVLIFLMLLGLIVAGLLVAQVARRRTNAKMARKRAESPKKPILRSYSHPSRNEPVLAPKEQSTLDHLAWMLKDPSRSDKLLQDDALLLRTARQGIREGLVTEMEAMRLLRRLQIDVTALNQKQAAASSAIPTGAEVSLSSPAMAMGTGELLLSTESALQLRIDKGANHFKAGDPVDVICHSEAGMHQFHTSVIAVKGKNLSLRHTPHVRHAQRRRFRRREIGLPLQITLPGTGIRPLSSATVDLSIGGMALKNPKKRLTEGAYIECSIDSRGASPLIIKG